MVSPSDAPVPDPLADHRLTAIGLLFEVNAGLRDVVDRHLEANGTSGSAFEVLVRLARSPGHRLRMSELAAQSTLTNSGLTRLVDRLQASGLLERRPDPADRRIWRLHLLPAAEPVLDELAEQRASLVTLLTSRVDPAAVAVLTDALLRMRATLSRRPDADAVLAAIEENA